MALRVQNQALMRKLGETQAEVDRLTKELENCRIEEAKQGLANSKNKKGG